MRILTIKENDANQRLDKYLQKALPTLPKSLMYKYIRNKKIKVNKKKCEISTRLVVNDEIMCYIAEEFFDQKRDDSFLQATSPIHILYEDENLVVMNKPVGLLVHSDDTKEYDTLVNRMKYYLYQKNEYAYYEEASFAPALCHRLDRNTQGIVIGAKNAQALRDMNAIIHDGQLHKKYMCVVEGVFDKKEDIVYAYHKKENQVVYISDVEEEGYKQIKTGYQVKEEKNGYSLLCVDLYSGKSHQIRAMMAHLHHPLYGDVKYGAKKQKYPYQALCAYLVRFNGIENTLQYLNGMCIRIDTIEFMKYF